jgi:SpoVK/Ycf46/Vps4 family AAA+-type ATPase
VSKESHGYESFLHCSTSILNPCAKANMFESQSQESSLSFKMKVFIGADFYALASDAMTCAINSKVKELESLPVEELQKFKAGLEPVSISVGEEHFEEALSKLVPSVSIDEIRRYKEVREKFQGPSKPNLPSV